MQGKRLTVEMKKVLNQQGFYPDEWLYQKNTSTFYQFCKKDDRKEKMIIHKSEE